KKEKSIKDDRKLRWMCVIGDRAWVSASEDGLFCFDLSDPTKLAILVGGTDFPTSWQAAALGSMHYQSHRHKGEHFLRGVELAERPNVVFQLKAPIAGEEELGTAIAAGADYLALAVGPDWDSKGIALFQLRDPRTPQYVSRLNVAGCK